MKDFIQPPKEKKVKTKIDQDKIDQFIDRFNKYIKKGEPSYGSSFVLNNAFAEIPHLNDAEFEAVIKQARKNGYILTQKPDNYQSISYCLTPVAEQKKPRLRIHSLKRLK